MATYNITDIVENDLADMWDYLADQVSEEFSQRQDKTFLELLSLLTEIPSLDLAYPELAHDLHIFADGSYLIVYRPTDYGVEIVRVLNGSRDIEALF